MGDNKPLFEQFCEYFRENTIGQPDYLNIRTIEPTKLKTNDDMVFHVLMTFCDFIGDTPIVNIEKIEIEKNDVIVHRSKRSRSLESIINMHTKLSQLFPENKVLVLDNGEDVEIISGDKIK